MQTSLSKWHISKTSETNSEQWFSARGALPPWDVLAMPEDLFSCHLVAGGQGHCSASSGA